MRIWDENTKKEMLGYMVKGNFCMAMLDIYKDCPESRELTIPKTGNTALHVAVSEESEHSVEEIIASVPEISYDVLKIGNKQGDTCLHLAATLGNAYLCYCIAGKDCRLIGLRNEFGETPLFSAVSRGRTQAFLYLHHLCKSEECQQYGYLRRNKGDTILHSAISEQHFDVAYIIINEYQKMVHMVNEDGLSPLHLLATRPSIFPSGVHLFGIRKLVYRGVRVRKLAQIPDLAKAPDPVPKWKTQLGSAGICDAFNCRSICDTYLGILLLPCSTIFDLLESCVEDDDEEEDEETSTKEQGVHREHLEEDIEATNRTVDRGEIQLDEGATTAGQGHGETDQRDEADANKQDHSNFFRNFKDLVVKIGGVMCGLLVCPIVVLFLSLVYAFWYLPKAFRILRIPFKLAKYIIGYDEYVRLKHIKKRCIWCVEVMNKLIEYSGDVYEQRGMRPDTPKEDHIFLADVSPIPTIKMGETPILIAAKHGISEMVLRILDVYPVAKHDVNSENRNILMLAVEHRHPHLYEELINNWNFKKTIFGEVDKDGNSLLHIAANLQPGKQFWRIRGAALHMHMEVKWYKFIKSSMPPQYYSRFNNNRQTSKEIFQESHRLLIDEGQQWLTSTSQSCSVVAALIATVAFATSATVPGGLKQDSGVPSLEHMPIFVISASSSLIALSFSMISVVMFLGILTSSFELKDFRKDLPYKLLLGLISLLISIISMFISFYAGHYFVLKQEFNHSATFVYASLCLPLILFIVSKFPLDFEIVWTTLRTKPRN